MLREGGRIGLKGGADASGKEVSISPTGDVRTSNVSPGAGNSRRGPGPDDRSTEQQNINQLRSQNRFVAEDEDLLPGDIPDERVDIPLTNRERDLYENRDLFINDTSGRTLPGILGKIISLNRKPNRTFFYERVLKNNAQGLNYTQLEQAYEDYMTDRMSGKTDAMGNTIMTGGDDPFIPNQMSTNMNQTSEEEEEVLSPVQQAILDRGEASAFLADGGMPKDAPVGGIMDLESGRQMYFLGKLVKKATRAVKKIVKSPIGKAALLYGGGSFLGGGGGGLTSIFGKDAFLRKTLLPKLYKDKALTGLGKLAIGGGLTLAPLLFQEEEEEPDFSSNRGKGLDIEAIRKDPYKFMGSAYGLYADGGDVKEPVAKKTMPLLDMDGQEMDLRAEGGFVPLGRMERADDVPARLSKNEFVFTADAVRNAGEGDIDKGADVMYNMMKNLEAGGEVSEESQGLEGAREMFQTSQRLEEVI